MSIRSPYASSFSVGPRLFAVSLFLAGIAGGAVGVFGTVRSLPNSICRSLGAELGTFNGTQLQCYKQLTITPPVEHLPAPGAR